MPVFLLPFGSGATSDPITKLPALSEGSYNFYQGRGYLRNYPGRDDIFEREGDLPAHVSTPPPTDTPITRVFIFRDATAGEHTVFVQGNTLYRKDGNGRFPLWTFVGKANQGLYFPHIFAHEGKLVILNEGDVPLVWDGFEKVVPLGVQETPHQPDVQVYKAPGSSSGVTDGMFQYATVWWVQDRPVNSLAENKGLDEVTGEPTVELTGCFQGVVQFADKWGNLGRLSPATRNFYVSHSKLDGVHNFRDPSFAVMSWYPPLVDVHIRSARFGRTVNLHPYDIEGGIKQYNRYFLDGVYDNVTHCRHTFQQSDTAISANGEMDTTVGPPPGATIGTSWGGRIFLVSSEDPTLLWYSDAVYFGQYRPSQVYRAKDHISAVIGMGDRLAIITHSTIEVLYLNNGIPARLSQEPGSGSMYGRSFVSIGNAIFGLWNDGFGVYDGNSVRPVSSPEYIIGDYIDTNLFAHSAYYWKGVYHLSVRHEANSATNNILLRFDFRTQQWYLLKESIYDIAFLGDVWLGCDDSIYELYRGAFASDARLVIDGLIPEGSSIAGASALMNMRLLMQPSSTSAVDVTVSGRFSDEDGSDVRSTLLPDYHGDGKVVTWGQPGADFVQAHKWIRNSDVWVDLGMDVAVSGIDFDADFTFPSGHLVELKALELTVGAEQRSD